MTESTLAASEGVATLDAQKVESYLRAFALINGYDEPARPSSFDIAAAAAGVQAALGCKSSRQYGKPGGYNEGRTFRLSVSPGVVGVRSMDARGLDAREEREKGRARVRADEYGALWVRETRLTDGGELVTDWYNDGDKRAPKSEIREWSAKSRATMVRTVASLDYSEAAWPKADGALGMVTLTLPGDWQTVAPTGKAFKAHIEKLRRRFTRAGVPWRGLWKLEFQGRGAPHLHALMRVPALVKGRRFEEWLSETWADVVAHPDQEERAKHLKAGTGVDFSGKDFSDPRRIALYFLGHSAKSRDGKEYQHIVPDEWQKPGAGPGRFWGYWGLTKAEEELDIDVEDFDVVRREFRKAARARSFEVALLRERGRAREAGAVPLPAHRVKGARMVKGKYGGKGGLGGGWVLLNDGPAFVKKLGAHLAGRCEHGGLCSWCGHIEPSTTEGRHKTFRPAPASVWPLVR